MRQHSIKIEHKRLFLNATKHWKFVAPLLSYPKNESEYLELIAQLEQLLDEVGSDEHHPLIGLVDALGNIIALYEENHFAPLKSRGVEALKFLMESYQLQQSDFPEIATQGVMSEILNGKRSLNLRQIKLLSKRFNVSPATFIDDD